MWIGKVCCEFLVLSKESISIHKIILVVSVYVTDVTTHA